METIIYALNKQVATISLNRPDVFNAFNTQLHTDLLKALKQAEKDPEVRVIVLTGVGKAFCSGQDLKEVLDNNQKDLSITLEKHYNPLIKCMRNMPKPIIAAVNGVAAGAGCSLALAADLIVAAESAKFIEVFVGIGLVLDSGSSFFLPRAVGATRAFEMATMGTRISAAQALEWGMVNKVVPDDELLNAVATYTDYYATAPTKAIGLMKQMLNQSFNSNLAQMLEMETYYQKIAGTTHDYEEGVAAFIAKRKPTFTGK